MLSGIKLFGNIILRIVAVFAASGLSVIGAGSVAGISVLKAITVAGLTAVAAVVEKLARGLKKSTQHLQQLMLTQKQLLI